MSEMPPLPKSKEASGSQASSSSNKKKASDGGDVLVGEEHRYMALPRPKELNHRRTRLQLGLPGSPEGEEPTLSAAPPAAAGAAAAAAATGNGESAPQKQQQQQQQRSSSSSSSLEDPAHQSSRTPPVGWPPVQSFRKNSLTAAPQAASKPVAAAAGVATVEIGSSSNSSRHQQQQSSLFVKVYMDGVPIGRKVNLWSHGSYDKLSVALEDMFRRFITGQSSAGVKAANEYSKLLLAECKKCNFIYGSDYVLTYEDRDGDLMLVGDVPWELFVGNVKRLRIMKGSEAIGLAPRNVEDQNAAAVTATVAK